MSVFSDDSQTGENVNNEVANPLEVLVGEDKKFKTIEDLAKGKLESDAYIETLTRKLDALQEEVQKGQTAKEIADQLREQFQKASSNPNPNQNSGENEDGTNTNNNSNQNRGISEEDILSLVEKRLSERESTSKAQRNLDEVNKVLQEKIGATAPKFISDKAAELGVTKEYLEQQAAVSPKAFYNLIGLNQQAPNQNFTPPASSVQTANVGGGGTVRDKKYYDKLYRENPSLRTDKATTIQEHKDAMALGAKFYE